MVANREAARDALATLLTAALVGTGKPVQAVYNYRLGKFSASPVVMVLSGGSYRKPRGMSSTKYENFFYLTVMVWIADADAASGWTELDVEDKLDDIENRIAQVIADNRKTANWEDIQHKPGEPSVILNAVTKAGQPYVLEQISLEVKVYD